MLPRWACKPPLPVGRRANPQNVRSPRLPSRRDRKASDTGITNDERGNGTDGNETCPLTSRCTPVTTSPTSPPGRAAAAAPEPCPTTPRPGNRPGSGPGKAPRQLGLAGQVDPKTIERLYQENIGPGGELLVKRRQSKAADERETRSGGGVPGRAPVRQRDRAGRGPRGRARQGPAQVPYFDLTVSAVKSVSVLHASYRVSARQARERGDEDQAAALDARADELEDALMDSAREAVALAGAARHLHPDRAPFRPHGGVARRRRPGRQLVPAPPVPGRRPAAPRARRDLEPGPARRRSRRQVADPGLPHPAQPAARRRPGRRPDPGDQAVRPRVRDGAPGGRQRRRGRRGQPGRHGPVQLPRRRRHRRTGPARPRVPGRARQAAVAAHAVAAAPAGRAEHPPHQEPGPPHHRRADRRRRNPPTAQRLAAWEAQTVHREVHAAVGGARAGRGVRRRARRACTGRAG